MPNLFVATGANGLPYVTNTNGWTGQYNTTLVNGLNSNVTTFGLPTLRVTGPTGAFSVGGLALTGNTTPDAGQTLALINTTSQVMTLVHEDLLSTAQYRIAVGAGTSTMLPPHAAAFFVYDGTTHRWALQNIGLQRPTDVNVRDFGAKGDGQRVQDATITSGTTSLTSSSAAFVASDVGKLFTLYKYGSGTVLTGTISAVNSPNNVTLSVPAAVTAATVTISSVANTNPAQVNTTTAHGMATGDVVNIAGVTGATAVNGQWVVAVTGANSYTVGVAAGGTYAGGGATSSSPGIFTWGTDDTSAIQATITAASTLLSTGTLEAAEVYFPAGYYCVSGGFALTSSYTNLGFRGVGSSIAGGGSYGSKLALMASASYLFRITCGGTKWRDLWIDGNRVASDVLDFEYPSTVHTFDRCRFTGATTLGYIHHYGKLVADLEVDATTYRDCYLGGDYLDTTYYSQCCVYNENAEAVQNINYYGGWFQNAVYLARHLQGSCNYYGQQMFRWTVAAISIATDCAPFEINNVYNEHDTLRFLEIMPTAGAASLSAVTLRNCNLQNTPIYTCHTMQLVLEDCLLGAYVFSDPAAATFAGVNYGIQPIKSTNTTFANTASFQYVSGIPGQLVLETNTTYMGSSGVTTVTDGAMTSGGNTLTCSTSHPFTAQSVGMPVEVAGAGNGYIIAYSSSSVVTVSFSASATVSGATVGIGFVGTLASGFFSYPGSRQTSPGQQVGNAGYDADGLYLGCGTCPVGLTVVPDGAMTSGGSTLTCATSTPFTTHSVGMPVEVTGAGSGYITAFTDSSHVTVSFTASATVSSARVSISVPILAADWHDIYGLSADRSYTLSTLGVGANGIRMKVTRRQDTHKTSVTYATGVIELYQGQWCEFEWNPASGWEIAATNANWTFSKITNNVTVSGGADNIIATATRTIVGGGNVEVVASAGPNNTGSWTSGYLAIVYALAGTGLGGAIAVAAQQTVSTTSNNQGNNICAIITGLTTGTAYDFYLVVGPSGGNFATGTTTLGGIVAREL